MEGLLRASIPVQRNLHSPMALSCSEEHPMADNKNPNVKQPGEKPEGKYHYNPGNQSGKTAENLPKDEAKEEAVKEKDKALHDRP